MLTFITGTDVITSPARGLNQVSSYINLARGACQFITLHCIKLLYFLLKPATNASHEETKSDSVDWEAFIITLEIHQAGQEAASQSYVEQGRVPDGY